MSEHFAAGHAGAQVRHRQAAPMNPLIQLIKLTQSIFDGFECRKPKRSALVLLDFQRAYDRVWHAGLAAKLARLDVPACVTRWILATLRDRRGRVRWEASLSDSRLFAQGLAQGSVLAPCCGTSTLTTSSPEARPEYKSPCAPMT